MEEFIRLGLTEKTIKALEKKGYTEPTEIQAKAIPLLLEGKKDVVGKSQTGTGKTASFALPILEQIDENGKNIQAIVLAPTRELAIQVTKEFESLKGERKIKLLAVYGGSPIGKQLDKLKEGVDIVVGTPGRVKDLQKRRALKLDNIQYAVLDEADEMLNMGFVEDIESILRKTPEEKKMLLFSATMPKPILRIAKQYMKEYELIEVEKTDVVTKTVEQIYYDIAAKDRVEGLKRIIDFHPDFYGIIFCKTRARVDFLTQQLMKMNYNAASLHGDISQDQREKILLQFRNKRINILVATDVAARGIDVDDLTHVVNYSLPQSPEIYVHRIGRTGRAGKKGISITFVIPSERRGLKVLERVNKCKLEKQELPTANDIIKKKEENIQTILNNIIVANSGNNTKFNSITAKLMKEYDPQDVILALLKFGFRNELDYNKYKDIKDIPKSDREPRRDNNRGKYSRRDKQGRNDRRSSPRFGRKAKRSRSSDGNNKRRDSGNVSFGRKRDKKSNKSFKKNDNKPKKAKTEKSPSRRFSKRSKRY